MIVDFLHFLKIIGSEYQVKRSISSVTAIRPVHPFKCRRVYLEANTMVIEVLLLVLKKYRVFPFLFAAGQYGSLESICFITTSCDRASKQTSSKQNDSSAWAFHVLSIWRRHDNLDKVSFPRFPDDSFQPESRLETVSERSWALM